MDGDMKNRFREIGFRTPCLQQSFRFTWHECREWAGCYHLAAWDACEIAATLLPHRNKAAKSPNFQMLRYAHSHVNC
jgi:hypothetical protein